MCCRIVDACRRALRIHFKARLPKPLFPEEDAIAWVRGEKGSVEIGTDPEAAVQRRRLRRHRYLGIDGQSDAARRKNMLAPYAGRRKTYGKAAKNAIFMHCLPAYRGHEVTEDVLEVRSPSSSTRRKTGCMRKRPS